MYLSLHVDSLSFQVFLTQLLGTLQVAVLQLLGLVGLLLDELLGFLLEEGYGVQVPSSLHVPLRLSFHLFIEVVDRLWLQPQVVGACVPLAVAVHIAVGFQIVGGGLQVDELGLAVLGDAFAKQFA